MSFAVPKSCSEEVLCLRFLESGMYIPFSQFRLATPKTSSWQHTGVARAPQTEAWRATNFPTAGERALMTAAEVRLMRAVMVASVNCIVDGVVSEKILLGNLVVQVLEV